MTKSALTLLSISLCSLHLGVAYPADAVEGPIRIAAISSPAVTAPRAAPQRTLAESRLATVAAPIRHVVARPGAAPHRSATATAAARTALDLRPPALESMPWTEPLLASVPADTDELQALAVVAKPLSTQEVSNTNLSPTGIGSLYWGARHPAHAWRLLTPMDPVEEAGAYADIRAKCAVFPGVPGGRAACP